MIVIKAKNPRPALSPIINIFKASWVFVPEVSDKKITQSGHTKYFDIYQTGPTNSTVQVHVNKTKIEKEQ